MTQKLLSSLPVHSNMAIACCVLFKLLKSHSLHSMADVLCSYVNCQLPFAKPSHQAEPCFKNANNQPGFGRPA